MGFKHTFINELTPFAYERLSVTAIAISTLNTNYADITVGCLSLLRPTISDIV